MKKTVKVKHLIDKVNKLNRNSETFSPEQRQAINMFVENILLECGVYEGFGYLSRKDVPKGQQPGVQWTNENKTVWSDTHDPINTPCPVFPDESRRHYYYHRDLLTPCQLCNEPTIGSTGAAGIEWDNICQVCKDKEDKAAMERITEQAQMFSSMFEGLFGTKTKE